MSDSESPHSLQPSQPPQPPQSIEMSKIETDHVIDHDLGELIDDADATVNVDNAADTATAAVETNTNNAGNADNANLPHVQFPTPDDANDANDANDADGVMNETGESTPVIIDVDDSVLYSSVNDSDSDDCTNTDAVITAYDKFVRFYRGNKMAVRVVTVAVIGTIAVAVVAPRIVRK